MGHQIRRILHLRNLKLAEVRLSVTALVREGSGGRAFLSRQLFDARIVQAGAVPGYQAIEIVTIGAVSLEALLIKKALYAAAYAHLVGMLVGAYRPTHLPVPATPK
jgi:hypothetical protein